MGFLNGTDLHLFQQGKPTPINVYADNILDLNTNNI